MGPDSVVGVRCFWWYSYWLFSPINSHSEPFTSFTMEVIVMNVTTPNLSFLMWFMHQGANHRSVSFNLMWWSQVGCSCVNGQAWESNRQLDCGLSIFTCGRAMQSTTVLHLKALPRFYEIGWISCVLLAYCRQENAIFLPHFIQPAAWEEPFSAALFRSYSYSYNDHIILILGFPRYLGQLMVILSKYLQNLSEIRLMQEQLVYVHNMRSFPSCLGIWRDQNTYCLRCLSS